MYKNTYGGGFKNFMIYIGAFFTFFSIAMGFSTLKDGWKKNKYIKTKPSVHVILEGLLAIYFIFGMYSAFIVGDQGGDFGLFPFHFMLFIGFSYVFFKSVFSKA
jgi:hypothetical protein